MIDRQLSIFTNVISFLTFVYTFGGQYRLQIRVSFFYFFGKNDWTLEVFDIMMLLKHF